MNKKQAEVEKQLLENEKEVLKKLKRNYIKALSDIQERIKVLQSNEMTQSKIYQIQYQRNLEKQLKAIVDLLGSDNVKTINDYLIKQYQDSFIGILYNMQQNEGIPFIMPINQETVVKSITKKTEDYKISERIYKNTEQLKNTIQSEISRGISQGQLYTSIARNIKNYSEADLKKSYRIARTEGGRVQSEAKFDVMKRAKENGADVVKQWDSTIDSKTRMTHAQLDGQIRELEEPFEINGYKAMYPHDFGIAEEDINCRCCVLERARWAVKDETNLTKIVDGDTVEFKNIKDYQDFKQKYLDFYKDYDKISKTNKEGIEKVQYIGRLDKNKLGEYADTITTEEVILSEERIRHIQERHPRRL